MPASASLSTTGPRGPAVYIKIDNDGIVAKIGEGSAVGDRWLSVEMLLALELLLHDPRPDAAAAQYDAIIAGPVAASSERLAIELERNGHVSSSAHAFVLQRGALLVVEETTRKTIGNLTQASAETRQVLRALARRRGFETGAPGGRAFPEVLREAEEMGLIAPVASSLAWGDLRRLVPICPWFGFSRGTPIDRYYLEHFARDVREQVCGCVVDIGGRPAFWQKLGFARVSRRCVVDIAPQSGVDVVGNAADPLLFEADSVDGVLAFNVLEHCPVPQAVVDAVRRWLRPGGKLFCMVPSVQRVHRMPSDYCRLLPAALEVLFRDWSTMRLHVYGNPLTSIAALMGVAAEELDVGELDALHPDYPVATCAVATK